ncbi:MAG: hypothetical protein KDB57_05660 [Solirubrobacterales bacterium]|jgi:hypothetical protein|nr:hypothetical protein [Solirubrobacterales bacterium]
MDLVSPIVATASPFYWIPFLFIFVALFVALWGALREDGSDLKKVEEREK